MEPDHPMETEEILQRVIYREFLLEPGLYLEAGLEDLPRKLASLLECGEEEAVARLAASPLLEPLGRDQLKELLAIRDMQLFSRTSARVAEELKDPSVSYDACLRKALCYATRGMSHHPQAFSALRAAAARNDHFARHHYLYGILLGLDRNPERAIWELGMALAYEPYEEGRKRIERVQEILRSAA